MIRAFDMNNLTLIILVSFSVINILYLGSDVFLSENKNPLKDAEDCKNEEPEQHNCQKCNEFLNCKSQKNERIVRKTKTSSKSHILGNGDLVEQTTVTEVTETITHSGLSEEDDVICSDKSSYYECLDTCGRKENNQESEERKKEKEEPGNDAESPVVPFGCKLEEVPTVIHMNNEEDNVEREYEITDKEEGNKLLEESIPSTEEIIESSNKPLEPNNNNAHSREKTFNEKKLPPPNIQLSTGLTCCISRLVTSAFRTWTFYLSGLIKDIPLFCADRCLYTRDNDTTSYCFLADKGSSCSTNVSGLMRLNQENFRVTLDDLKTREELLADQNRAPVIKLDKKENLDSTKSCCSVKQVVEDAPSSGLFVLRGKTPDRRGLCLDHCIYVKVGDVRQTKYCFGSGHLGTACHPKVPSISTLLNTNTTLREAPLRLDECVNGPISDPKIKQAKSKISITKPQNKQEMHKDTILPILFKNEPVKMKSGEVPVVIDIEKEGYVHNGIRITKLKKNVNVHYEETKKIKSKNENKENIPLKANNTASLKPKEMSLLEPKEEIVIKPVKQTVIKPKEESITKPKEETVIKPKDEGVIKHKSGSENNPKSKEVVVIKQKSKEKVINKTKPKEETKIKPKPKEETVNKKEPKDKDKNNIKSEKESVIKLEPKDEAVIKSKVEFLSNLPIQGQKVLVCSSKCSIGTPMKLGVRSAENRVKVGEKSEQPLKVNCKMRVPMKLIEIPTTTEEKKANKQNIEKTEPEEANNCNLKNCHGSEKKLTLPYQLEKKNKLKKNKSSTNETNKFTHEKLNKDDTGEETAIKLDGINSSSINKNEVSNMDKTDDGNSELVGNEHSSNETAKNIENRNMKCAQNRGGERTLPYRITLTERPKLIKRENERSKTSDKKPKAEMPVRIACCKGGKPYKLKTFKMKSEPVEVNIELSKPLGMAPIKLMSRDTLEI